MEHSISWKRTGSGEILKEREKNGVPYLTFPVFEEMPWLVHGFSTRYGGVSTEELSSMNLSFSREKNQQQLSNVSQKDVKSIPLYGKIENK